MAIIIIMVNFEIRLEGMGVEPQDVYRNYTIGGSRELALCVEMYSINIMHGIWKGYRR